MLFLISTLPEPPWMLCEIAVTQRYTEKKELHSAIIRTLFKAIS